MEGPATAKAEEGTAYSVRAENVDAWRHSGVLLPQKMKRRKTKKKKKKGTLYELAPYQGKKKQ